MRHLGRGSHLSVAFVALAVVAGAFASQPQPTRAWANGGGDGYGTHDWIIDQAMKVLDGRVDGWFDAATARIHSDDPDTIEVPADPASAIDHVYKDGGKRGGAIDRIAYEYDIAQADYQAGNYEDASYHIGLLAHFYGDILQPFHTSEDADGKDSAHQKYELLVTASMHGPNDDPQWSSSRRTVSDVPNIRTKSVAAAAYSRGYFDELYAQFSKDESKLNTRVSEITGLVLKRAANDLADVIWSIGQGVGAQPQVGSIKTWVKWVGVRSGFTAQAVYVTAKDVNGKPIEGLKVTVSWPTTTGTRTEVLYTDPNGYQKRVGTVGTSPKLKQLDVVATATVRGTVTTSHAWWAITPTLGSGAKGFKTAISDTTVVPGQTVKVTSLARDTKGHGIPNLLVTWTWNLNGKTLHTSGVTNANGRASSTLLVTSSTTKARITVTAHTQSASHNRSVSVSFKRVK